MYSNITNIYVSSAQVHLYYNLNNFAHKNELAARYLAPLPVVIVEGILEVIKAPLFSLEYLVTGTINLCGSLYYLGNSSRYSIKKSIIDFSTAIKCAVTIPINLVSIIFKIIYQCVSIIKSPKTVKPFSPNAYYYSKQNIIITFPPHKPFLAEK